MNLNHKIAVGKTANVYLWKDKVLKVYKEGFSIGEALYEADKQRSAYSSGLNVPKVLNVTEKNRQPLIVMEYVKGKTLGELFQNNKDQTEYYLRLSIDIQMKIYSVKLHSLESMTSKLERQILSSSLLDEEKRSSIIRRMHSIEYVNSLCHGDFHMFNLIKNGEEITIIDWVDASIGDTRADAYRSYLLYLEHSKDLAEMYLNFYCEKRGQSKDEINQWAPIIAAARLSENISTEHKNQLLEIINSEL